MVESVARNKANVYGPLTLQLGSSIPSNPFVNNSFPVQLYLLDGQKQLLQGYVVVCYLQPLYLYNFSSYTIPVEMQVYLQGVDTPLSLVEVCVSFPFVLLYKALTVSELEH
jgi:hypothetical protein